MLRKPSNRVVYRCVVVLAIAFVLAGCGMPDNVVRYTDVNVVEWQEEAVVEYENEYDNKSDEARLCDMDMLFHVNRHFVADTLDVRITTITPDSLRYTERLYIPVRVEWSKATEYSADVLVPYRRNVTFDKQGVYVIGIEPVVAVSGVESVGINFQMK